jgi:FkbM family methyltransferase
MIIEADGLSWIVDDQLSGDRIGPDHEEPLRERILDLIPTRGTFVDVGAHVGCYSLRAALRAANVYAIEPNPEAAERLDENRRLNGIWNIRIIPAAAWDKVTALTLVSPNGFPRDASMRTVYGLPNATVLAFPLDELLFDLPQADLIKLDVEGSDLQALEGMRKLVARLQPVLIIEDHSVLGYFGPQELQNKITSLSYVAENFGTYGGATYWGCHPKGQQ